jgi:hypothetical protein
MSVSSYSRITEPLGFAIINQGTTFKHLHRSLPALLSGPSPNSTKRELIVLVFENLISLHFTSNKEESASI